MIKKFINFFKPHKFFSELYFDFICNKLHSSPFRNFLLKKMFKIPHKNFYFSTKFNCATKNIYIGEYTFINHSFSCLGYGDGRLTIGSFSQIGPGVFITLGSHSVEDMKTYPGDVVIGEMCWIGANVTILPGVTIGDGCVIGACSLINKDIPPYSIVAGVPGKVLKKREVVYPYFLARGGMVLKENGEVVHKSKL